MLRLVARTNDNVRNQLQKTIATGFHTRYGFLILLGMTRIYTFVEQPRALEFSRAWCMVTQMEDRNRLNWMMRVLSVKIPNTEVTTNAIGVTSHVYGVDLGMSINYVRSTIGGGLIR